MASSGQDPLYPAGQPKKNAATGAILLLGVAAGYFIHSRVRTKATKNPAPNQKPANAICQKAWEAIISSKEIPSLHRLRVLVNAQNILSYPDQTDGELLEQFESLHKWATEVLPNIMNLKAENLSPGTVEKLNRVWYDYGDCFADRLPRVIEYVIDQWEHKTKKDNAVEHFEMVIEGLQGI